MNKLVFLLLASFATLVASNAYSTKSEWLMDVNDTDKRFELIQKQLRGFDTAMTEVGYRYEETKKAISKQNYALAEYHWDKIKVAVDNGVVRRPARKEALESFFLNGIWVEVKSALSKRNKKAVNAVFPQVKPICNACHESQKVGFIVIE